MKDGDVCRKKNRPTVSALTPTYNRAGRVVRAVESVLIQSRRMPKVIVTLLREVAPAPLRKFYRDTRSLVLSLGLPSLVEYAQPDSEREAAKAMSVIIPVKDAPVVTRRCFLSLEKFASGAEIIIVNDGSKLEETNALFAENENRNHWAVIHHSESKGHSRSCESGAAIATKPYLCLLNSDTVITPWSWRAAIDAFEADPKIGVTGPSTSYSATVQTIRRALHCRHYWNDSQISSFAKRYMDRQQPKSWVDLPIAGGFAFFIRKDLWENLAGFDPNLPDYGNESELCKRVLKAGFRIVWTKNSYIHHLGNQSYADLGQKVIVERSIAAREYINQKHR